MQFYYYCFCFHFYLQGDKFRDSKLIQLQPVLLERKEKKARVPRLSCWLRKKKKPAKKPKSGAHTFFDVGRKPLLPGGNFPDIAGSVFISHKLLT